MICGGRLRSCELFCGNLLSGLLLLATGNEDHGEMSQKSGKFFRVQSTGRSAKTGSFVERSSPSGGKVVTIKRDTYNSAKKAAATAMSKTKQPA